LKDCESFYGRWIGKMKNIAFKNFSCSVKLLSSAFILEWKNEEWYGIFWIIHTHTCADISSFTTTTHTSNVKKSKNLPNGVLSVTE